MIDTRGDGGHPRLRGHAAVFKSLSQPINVFGFTFREQIAAGAFADSIARADSEPILAYWNHNPDEIIGNTENGSLLLSEDDHGLVIEIKPPATSRGDDAVLLIAQRYVSKMSFGFQIPVGGDSWDIVNGEDVRTLNKIHLIEVSPVGRPAYRDTEIGARLAELAGVEARDIESASARLAEGSATASDRALMRRLAERIAAHSGLSPEEQIQMEQNRRRLELASRAA